MEPDITQGATTGAVSTATPPPATPEQTTSTTSTATTQTGSESKTPDPGHAEGADFDHPQFGAKLRNMQKGMEENARKAKEWQEKHEAYTKQIGDLNDRLAAKPELLNQVRALYGLPPLPAPKEAEVPNEYETRTKQELERIEALRLADQAIFEKQLELGHGDLAKGRQLYESYSGPAFEIMKAFREGDARTQLNMALEYHLLKTQSTAPRTNGQNNVTIPATETGRGVTGQTTVDDGGPMTPEKALRLAGFTPASFLEAHHAFD